MLKIQGPIFNVFVVNLLQFIVNVVYLTLVIFLNKNIK
jgi:hypothetical protein